MRTTAPLLDVEHLLTLVTVEAKRLHDGHYAIFSFTTGYKVVFGTPDLDSGQGRSQLAAMPSFPTLQEELLAALVAGKACEASCTAPGTLRGWHPRPHNQGDGMRKEGAMVDQRSRRRTSTKATAHG